MTLQALNKCWLDLEAQNVHFTFFIPNESVPDLFSGHENCVNMYYDMALNQILFLENVENNFLFQAGSTVCYVRIVLLKQKLHVNLFVFRVPVILAVIKYIFKSVGTKTKVNCCIFYSQLPKYFSVDVITKTNTIVVMISI